MRKKVFSFSLFLLLILVCFNYKVYASAIMVFDASPNEKISVSAYSKNDCLINLNGITNGYNEISLSSGSFTIKLCNELQSPIYSEKVINSSFKKNFNNDGSVKYVQISSNDYNGKFMFRKQTASMFVFEKNSGYDINTSTDSEKPVSYISNLYNTNVYKNYDSSTVINDNLMDTDIVFFSGHGYSNTDGVCFNNSSSIRNSTLPVLNNTKIAIWSACYQATSFDGNVSFAEKSVLNGAKSSIGFTKSVSVSDAKKFTNKLFQCLIAGKTLNEAAKEASSQWFIGNAKYYVVFGDGNVKITPSINVSLTKVANLNIDEEDNYVNDESEFSTDDLTSYKCKWRDNDEEDINYSL